METKYTKYTNTFPQNKKKVYFPREDYKMLQNYCILLDYPMRDNKRTWRDTQPGMRMGRRIKMKNNVNMRKRHRIQQPGFDVQRRVTSR